MTWLALTFATLPTLPTLPNAGSGIWAQTAFNWGLVAVMIAVVVAIFRARRTLDQIIEDANRSVVDGLHAVEASVERLGEKVDHLSIRDGIVDMALRGMEGRIAANEDRIERLADRVSRMEGRLNAN